MTQYSELFTPFKVGGANIKNRLVLCAMEGTNMVEGMTHFEFNEHCHDYYIERAKHEVGLMIPGMVPVRCFMGEQWLGDQEELMMGPVKALLDEVHQYGSKVFFQIGAGMGRVMLALDQLRHVYFNDALKQGAKAKGLDVDRIFSSATDGLPNVWDPQVKSRAMTVDEIHEIVREFGKAALLCKRAGVDGIEIHAVHEGYLLDQFCVAATNKRTDEYGGSLENRYRFVSEIIAEIKKICGADYPVSVRYSVESKMIDFNVGALPGEDYQEFGRDAAEGIEAAKLLERAGADMLNCDNGSYDSWYWAHPPLYMPLSCNLESAQSVKPHVSIPVVCAGRMENPETATAALRAGQIDAVGIARQFLCDAEYATKVREGRLEDIRPCIACHNGCFGVSKYKGNPASAPETPMGHCALNPTTFSEQKYRIIPADTKKRVAVIGGGIGGMESARLCAMRGHEVTIYEKSDELGGVFIAAGAPSFKEKDKMLLDWYRKQIRDLGISVRFNTSIDSNGLAQLDADEVIVATGARPRAISLTGAERNNVMEAIEYLRGYKDIKGERVAVIGGGLTGCEIAYDLILKGKQPVIIEMQDDILKVKDLSAANSNFLRDAFRRYETPVYLESKVSEITSEGVVIDTAEGSRVIAADSVILSVGYTPAPIESDTERKLVGDAAKVGNLLTVIWGAYDLALSI